MAIQAPAREARLPTLSREARLPLELPRRWCRRLRGPGEWLSAAGSPSLRVCRWVQGACSFQVLCTSPHG